MYQLARPIIAVFIVVLAAMSPTLLAQNRPLNSAAVGNGVTGGADGKILWQYNTDG